MWWKALVTFYHIHSKKIFFNLHLRICSLILERDKEKYRCEKDIGWLPPIWALAGDWTCNPGLWHNQKSNPQPFGVQDAAPTEPPGQGQKLLTRTSRYITRVQHLWHRGVVSSSPYLLNHASFWNVLCAPTTAQVPADVCKDSDYTCLSGSVTTPKALNTLTYKSKAQCGHFGKMTGKFSSYKV